MSDFFKDSTLQDQFHRDGFVKIKVFTVEEVTSFKSFYQSLMLRDERKYGFSVSIDELDDKMRTELNRFYKNEIFPRFSDFLNNPKFFTGSFMIKEPYPTGTVAAHQDWTFVDESRFQSLMCWISIDKTDISNGAMAFIKGGHHFYDQIRGFPCPLVPEPVEEFRYKLLPYMNVIDTEPGDVLIFDNKTIHGSFPNVSETTRHGISLTLTQGEADFVAYYLNPKVKDRYELIKYKVDDNFFDRYNNPKFHQKYRNKELLDDLEVMETIELIPQRKNWATILQLLEEHGNNYQVEYENKFGKLLKEQEKWHLEELRKLRKRESKNLFSGIKKLLKV